ncbi:hemagglutinin [Mycoplasmopsis synoviae]|uniref:hemagglutinin n=1 Tax=Mycoplasmopsis synoviae TaxID=2109 RepID=UPI001CE22E6C|nr:hemagglutinin [Mycoplasmopsis synoviae]UBX97236.1 hemagglutinin [Mycoplasmopsis synoviae]
MPKIVVPGYEADGEGKGKATHEEANKTKLEAWFASNQDKFTLVADQLTRKLGSDKFKNVTLTNPQVSYEEVTVNSNAWKNPKVTFNIQAKPGYQLTEPTTDSKQISLTIRVLYENQASTQNLLTIQGASPTAAPNTASVGNPATAIKSVNVYLNYTGPAIMLNADLPTVGGQENTLINGTSNVTGAFNNAFRGNPTKGLLFTNRYPNPLLQSVINYVNKFDSKFSAKFVTNSRDGVTITKVEKTKELRPGTLDDLVKNRNIVFLQQIKGDTEAVYFTVTALTNDKWLNIVLVRIPLTKFVRPLTEFQAQSATAPTQEGQTTQGQENLQVQVL